MVGMALFMVLGIFSTCKKVEWLVPVAIVASFLLWLLARRNCHTKSWQISMLLFVVLGAYLGKKANSPDLIENVLQSRNNDVTAIVCGTVSKVRTKSGNLSIVLKNCLITIPNKANEYGKDDEYVKSKKVLVYLDENQNIIEGDKISVTGKLELFEPAYNKGTFDARKYYKSQHIYSKCYGKSVEIVSKNSNRIVEGIFKIKQRMVKVCENCASREDAGVFMSIVLGDKSELEKDIQGLYQRNGIAHILAISGLHISMVGMFLYGVLRFVGFGILESATASLMLIAGYGLMTGNQTSAIRAIVMFGVFVYARVFGRKYDMPTAASLAAIMILAESPLMLFESGFLLSFGAVIGICYVYPVFEKMLPDMEETLKTILLKRFLCSVFVSISVSLVTIPIILCGFFEYPIYSIVLNLLVVPSMSLVMTCILGGCILGMFAPFFGKFLFGGAHYTLMFYSFLCHMVSKLPGGRLIPGVPQTWKIVVYYCVLLLIVVVSRWKVSKKILRSVVTGGVTFAMGIMFINPVTEFDLHMLYVGQGDGIFFRIPGGTTFLVDGGSSDNKSVGEYVLAPCLKASGISYVDYVFVSHTDNDHINGIKYLIENQDETGIKIGNLALPDIGFKDDEMEEIKMLAKANDVKVCIATDDMKISGDNGRFLLSCVYPNSSVQVSDKNAASMVLDLKFGDFKMLFTGDLDVEGERILLDSRRLYELSDAAGAGTKVEGRIVEYDILKVGHHGSKGSSSEEFLKSISPKVALISCGIGNSYGHPHRETLERLEAAGVKVLRTDELGAIEIKWEAGENITISGHRKPK